MHSLLARQIEQCTDQQGQLDKERFYALISSAYDDDARARHRGAVIAPRKSGHRRP